jgi:hypothetical protein
MSKEYSTAFVTDFSPAGAGRAECENRLGGVRSLLPRPVSTAGAVLSVNADEPPTEADAVMRIMQTDAMMIFVTAFT